MKVKPMVAELVATFLFVFAGVASVVAIGMEGAAAGHIAPSPAHGIAIAILVSATMHISGGQLNPAVTVGVWLGNQIPLGQAIANIFGQIVGKSVTITGSGYVHYDEKMTAPFVKKIMVVE